MTSEHAHSRQSGIAGDAGASITGSNAGTNNIPFRDWDFGSDLASYVWEANHPRAALLLQHGFGEYAKRYVEQYNALIPNLLDRGISVYAFDLQGHGHSPGRRAVTDVDQAVENHLAARRNLESLQVPLFLLGHSLGGIITATSVLRHPAGHRGVILSSPSLLVSANPLTRLFAQLIAAATPALPVKHLPPNGISRIPEQVETYINDPMIHHGKMPAQLAASILFTSRRNWDQYPRWTAPTLVLHGTEDVLTEPEGSRRFIETIASEDKTLHQAEGGYHELLNDLEKDETLQVVLQWLEQRIPRK